jgi:hypothetical protein
MDTQKENSSTNHEITDVRDWRNEHGEPDYTYLESLVTDGSIEAIEKLHLIAEDLDVSFNSSTPPEELMEKIRQAESLNEDANPHDTR